MDAKEFNRQLHKIGHDSRALERIYSFYYKRAVLHLTYHFSREVAEDAVQEFFAHLMDVGEAQPYISFPTSWIYKSVENNALRLVNIDNRYLEYNEALHGEYISFENSDNEEFESLISPLDDAGKTMMRLYYIYGYTLEEVAIMLSVKPATIRKRHTRAIKKLKDKCHI